MNKTILTGRTTNDIELHYTQTQKAFCQFTLAVNRRTKDEGADFIRCNAWGKTAELMEKYVKKGHMIGIVGRIQTGSYTDRENKKVYTTDVVVEELQFLEGKKEEQKEETTNNGLVNADDLEDEGLPFNN